jgi:hypothetical protein
MPPSGPSSGGADFISSTVRPERIEPGREHELGEAVAVLDEEPVLPSPVRTSA